MDLLAELQARGLIKDVTDYEGLKKRLETSLTLYCGFDPTADSLHIGHLQQVLILKRYQQAGHRVIALCGGGTGMIGDPRPTSERQLQSLSVIQENVQALKKQLSLFLDFSADQALLANNYDWLAQISLLDFLRDYGKHFNVNYMIAKDIVASRLKTGISFTEFSYTILQAIDWLKLYELYHCEAQIGGSDQWGNLTSGTELIRKMLGDQVKVFGITSSLIMKADGTKFGKSEGENIWLDANRTSPYEFYQYFVNTSDADIIDFLKRLSFRSLAEIEQLAQSVQVAPHLREAQKALAEELTALVHGEAGLKQALKITETFFSGNFQELTLKELETALKEAEKIDLKQAINIVDGLVLAQAASSKREARELLTNGSIQINGIKVTDLDYEFNLKQALYSRFIIIRRGKKRYYVLEFSE